MGGKNLQVSMEACTGGGDGVDDGVRKDPLGTPCLIACSDSVCGRVRWRHLVMSLSR